MQKDVIISVVIPAYNAEKYIGECINSLLNQTFKEFEIIVINDGSTDSTLEMLKEIQKYTDKMTCHTIKNHGQGYVRNLGLKKCSGEYVFFMDADDFLEPRTFELAYQRITEDNSDFVAFDWKYYNDISNTYRYTNVAPYFSKKLLEGEECLELLKTTPIFTVNKLYSKNFLINNKVYYGEGFIYEDNPFWVDACLKANKVSLIHSPLYNVRINQESTTKTNLETDRHAKGFIRAVESTIALLPEEEKTQYNDLYYYFFRKFCSYYHGRTPQKFKQQFRREFLDSVSARQMTKYGKGIFYDLCVKFNVFSKKKYFAFSSLLAAQRLFSFGKRMYRKLRFRVKKRLPKDSLSKIYEKSLLQPIFRDVVLFMGFDSRYTGNSRYLFEALEKESLGNVKMFFVTDDFRVPTRFRLEPESERFYKFMARAKVVVWESWTPVKFKKRIGSTWIQLWHGTPLKKMLFDSEEASITTKRPNHKNNKYHDIVSWDYFITDNSAINKYFETSMMIPQSKLLSCGYPRVKFLIENQNDNEYIFRIKQACGIDQNKKIIIYLPTWRDYNYDKPEDNFDNAYIMNLQRLSEMAGDSYVILHKKHQFKAQDAKVEAGNPNIINAADIETQELLLIADYLISDYSSVMFDALAIDLPVLIFCNDFEKYQKSRSVYPDLWKMLSPYVCNTEEEIFGLLQNYKIDDTYFEIKNRLSYKNEMTGTLPQFIIDRLCSTI